MKPSEKSVARYSELLMNVIVMFERQYGYEPIRVSAEQEQAARQIQAYFKSEQWLSFLNATDNASSCNAI